MRQLTPEEFYSYLATNKARYHFNPICEVAFRDVGSGKEGILLCKGRGCKEQHIERMDEDFEMAMMLHWVMSAEEYEQY